MAEDTVTTMRFDGPEGVQRRKKALQGGNDDLLVSGWYALRPSLLLICSEDSAQVPLVGKVATT